MHTNPRKEALVVKQLLVYDLDVFFPTILVERGYSRGTRQEPFFPRYLFVHADLQHHATPTLGRLFGVRGLVRFGEQPAAVPDDIIDHLRTRLASGNAPATQADHPYKEGQQVRIRSGPFEGIDAIFQKGIKGSERVQILVQALGQLSRMELNLHMIEAR